MRIHHHLLSITSAALILTLTSCVGTKDAATKVYELGSRVEVGHLIYAVYESQWLTQIGTGDKARVPKNRFLLLRISATNSGSEEMVVPNATLEDDKGNAVEELSDGDGVPQWIGYLRKATPADAISGNIVFDAEPKHYRVRVSDENGEKQALIDLPLSFSAESPQMPVPGGTTGMPGFTGATPVKK